MYFQCHQHPHKKLCKASCTWTVDSQTLMWRSDRSRLQQHSPPQGCQGHGPAPRQRAHAAERHHCSLPPQSAPLHGTAQYRSHSYTWHLLQGIHCCKSTAVSSESVMSLQLLQALQHTTVVACTACKHPMLHSSHVPARRQSVAHAFHQRPSERARAASYQPGATALSLRQP